MTNGLSVTIMMNELDHIQDDLEQQLRQEEYARARIGSAKLNYCTVLSALLATTCEIR